MTGDADVAAIGAAIGDRARARIILALGDGRALPASVLASQAGVARSTASTHLAHLLDVGLLTVSAQGRHRYYRLAGPHVGELLEALVRVAPDTPVRSLREGTRAEALRTARTCYDHLAGRLGVALMQALIGDGSIVGGDGLHRLDAPGADRLSARGRELDYRLTSAGGRRLAQLGIPIPSFGDEGLPLRYCVDRTEQAHHLSGALGRSLAQRLDRLRWLRRSRRSRAVHLTDLGREELRSALGVEL